MPTKKEDSPSQSTKPPILTIVLGAGMKNRALKVKQANGIFEIRFDSLIRGGVRNFKIKCNGIVPYNKPSNLSGDHTRLDERGFVVNSYQLAGKRKRGTVRFYDADNKKSRRCLFTISIRK